MAPKYDKAAQKWIATSPEEESGAGYPAINTLLIHGPKSFLTRVFQPDNYEQGVLKFMANDKVNRDVAQGNMDAYLENPNDWAFARFEAERTGVQPDYVSLKPKALALTLVWSSIVLFFGSRAFLSLTNPDIYFWAFLKDFGII